MRKLLYFTGLLLFLNACATSTETLFIGPAPVPCPDAGRKDCFQVKNDSAGEWLDFNGTITDFNYEPGYSYTLEVENTPSSTGGKESEYSLKKVLKKEKIPATEREPVGNFSIQTFKGTGVDAKKMNITFDAESGRVSGKGVCNRFMGTYTTSNGKIKFSQAATTKMMCHEPELERDFFQTMNKVDHFSLKEDNLKLMQGDTTVVTASLKR